MQSVREAVGNVRSRALNRQREEGDLLASGISETASALTLTVGSTFVAAGTVASLGPEAVFFASWDSAAKQATVVRGYYGTLPLVHATGAAVELNSRFPSYECFSAFRDEISSWPEGLFVPVTTEVDATARFLDLPESLWDCYGVIDVRRSATIDGDPPVHLTGCRLHRGADGSVALGVPTDLRLSSATLFVTVAMPFRGDLLTWEADLEAALGLNAGLVDLAKLGALVRLVGDSEIARSATGAAVESRKAADVPALAAMQAASVLERRYVERMRQEILRLAARWPVRVA